MKQLTAIDLFAGAGGATAGLQRAGVVVVAAVENNADAAASYRANHSRVFLVETDIRAVDPAALRKQVDIRRGSLDLLKACPPCQGFSALARGNIDEDRNDLVLDVIRFVKEFCPKSILLENVPGLRRDRRLSDLLSTLESDYEFRQQVVDATSLGVPQRRKRLVVFGLSKTLRKCFPESFESMLPKGFDFAATTVRSAFERLAEEQSPADPLNVYRKSTPIVLARIKAVPANGTRFDLPEKYQLACHAKLKNKNATSSYGRIRFDEPAPTMTTRCTTPACGSFIHPIEDRGITLREAATLQTFPSDYQFVGGYDSVERQIGNAVPVRMAEALGWIVRDLVRSTKSGRRAV